MRVSRNDNIYHNVVGFIARIKSKADTVEKVILIRQNLDDCLRGQVSPLNGTRTLRVFTKWNSRSKKAIPLVPFKKWENTGKSTCPRIILHLLNNPESTELFDLPRIARKVLDNPPLLWWYDNNVFDSESGELAAFLIIKKVLDNLYLLW